ncbi:MAG: Hsp20/alpha crystallin family protein [Taibaiella sp.]|nr:Hsp20/alpha crystallin family protein [Taibaiella sp.]
MNTQIKRINGNGAAPAPSFSGLVDRFFQDTLTNFLGDGVQPVSRSRVPVNVRETEKSIEMEFVAPGLRKEDFKVKVNRDVLHVSYEPEVESQAQEQSWLRREFQVNPFSHSFRLDEVFDAQAIQARYVDGILHISIPGKEGAQPLHRLVEVN